VTSALLSEALAPLRADPARAAILFDIDGTLAPIVEHAADARVPERTRQLLAEVARRYGVVACVSGRRASEARAMVAIGTISYLGSHGAEILRAGWTEPVVDPEIQDWAERIHEFAREADTADLRRRRVRLEDKGTIVAFHWRGAPDEAAAERAVQEIAASAQQRGLAVHWGRKVLEVRPPVQFDKGLGIAALLRGTEIEAAVYVGDDATDLDAFRGLRTMVEKGALQTALCVAVRSDEAPEELAREADLTVDGPGGVRGLLEALL
jgi:trehalose 6-phosphate phosphatase